MKKQATKAGKKQASDNAIAMTVQMLNLLYLFVAMVAYAPRSFKSPLM